MARTELTADLSLYVSPTGSPSNDGLTPTTPLSCPQDAIALLQNDYDLGGRNVVVNAAAGTYGSGISLSGRMVGQDSPGSLKVLGVGTGATILQPPSGHAGLEINYGAGIYLDQLCLDRSLANQDGVLAGKDADITLGTVRFAGGDTGHNHATLSEHCRLTVLGNLWVAGDAQCFLQMDQFSTAYWNTNGIPNQLAMFFEYMASVSRQPYWADAFLDVAGPSNCNIQNLDYHGWQGGVMVACAAEGYRLRLRTGATVNLNGLSVSTLPGSADTAWPYQGYLL